MKQVITDISELFLISEILNEKFNESDLSNMTIIFEVDSNLLKAINERIYYSNNKMGTPEETDEIIITVRGITFKYVIKEEI